MQQEAIGHCRRIYMISSASLRQRGQLKKHTQRSAAPHYADFLHQGRVDHQNFCIIAAVQTW